MIRSVFKGSGSALHAKLVTNDELARWIPPSDGSFYVRLTVADRAGNTASVRKRLTWGTAPAITNLASSPSVFSPDGNGVADTVTVNYVVLAPILGSPPVLAYLVHREFAARRKPPQTDAP